MKYKLIIALALIIIFLSGCSVFSPIGDGISIGYQSFVGYFNTYYNAKSAYKQGEESVYNYYNNPKNQYPTLDKLREVSYNDVPSDARMKFEAVIEKGSKILNYYSKSVLVDDAILLMGKSYFYNLEYTRAERKFLELLSQYPNSDLVPETKLWCAKAFLKNRREEDAKLLLENLIDYGIKENENDIVVRSYIILSDYYLSKNDTNEAIKYYNKALKFCESENITSQINFRLGEIYKNYDSLLLAADYFFKASDLTSDKYIKYWGMNNYGTIQIKLGKNELATRIFRDLEKNPQLREFLPYTYYELAELKLKNEDLDGAIDLFNMLDTTYAKTEPSAKGYYQLGLIYENYFKDYESARNYYQKSREQMSGISITPLVDDKLRKLESFLGVQKQAKISDSLFIIANIPDTSIVYKFEVNISALGKDSNNLFLKMKIDTFYSKYIIDDSTNKTVRDSVIKALVNLDSTLIADTTLKFVKTHIDTVRSVEGHQLKYQHYFAKYNYGNQKVDTIIVSELDRILSKDTTKIKNATKDLTKKKFDLAMSYMNDLGRLDTAIIIFEELLNNFPKDKNYHPELLFNLGLAYKKLNIKNEEADSLLNEFIKEYPDNSFISEAKLQLGISLTVKLDTAKLLYSKADSLFESGNIAESIKGFEELIKKYPVSDYAPKALYAIGWINENSKNNYNEAIKNYRKLLEEYPNSKFANLIKAKIDTVEKYFPSEKKIAKKDSLKKVDSLKTLQSKDNLNSGSMESSIKQGAPKEEIKNLMEKPKTKTDTVIYRRKREVE